MGLWISVPIDEYADHIAVQTSGAALLTAAPRLTTLAARRYWPPATPRAPRTKPCALGASPRSRRQDRGHDHCPGTARGQHGLYKIVRAPRPPGAGDKREAAP